MSKRFVKKTISWVLVFTMLLTFIPIPQAIAKESGSDVNVQMTTKADELTSISDFAFVENGEEIQAGDALHVTFSIELDEGTEIDPYSCYLLLNHELIGYGDMI